MGDQRGEVGGEDSDKDVIRTDGNGSWLVLEHKAVRRHRNTMGSFR